MGNRTDEILSDIRKGIRDENKVDFLQISEARRQLRFDIEEMYDSLTKFANECGIHTSHLSDFFNNGKKLGRDKLLTVCINLHYDFEKTQTILHRLEAPELYVRNKRDYQIAVGIQEGKSLDEIEEVLCEKGIAPLISQGKSAKRLPNAERGSKP